MTQIFRTKESKPVTVKLTPAEASQIRQAGKDLASKSVRYGASAEEVAAVAERTVVRVQPVGNGKYQVAVHDAVGLIATPNFQLHIMPKIPQDHLLHLFSMSGCLPKMSSMKGGIDEGVDLWILMATWFVRATENVFRRDLMRDYVGRREMLKVKRGRLHALNTARAFYQGRLELDCEFEEFEIDTPLNRILREGVRSVLSFRTLPKALRRSAASLNTRFMGVSDLQPGDLQCTADRRTHHYEDAISLAKQIIQGAGRNLGAGDKSAWTFLMRTPDLAEDGLRHILINALSDTHKVEKRGRQIQGSKMTLNPDLVFDHGKTVGDVKYKLLSNAWSRPDLYQLTTFATGFETSMGALLGFHTGGGDLPEPIQIGSKFLQCIAWDCDLSVKDAEDAFVNDVRGWLQNNSQVAA